MLFLLLKRCQKATLESFLIEFKVMHRLFLFIIGKKGLFFMDVDSLWIVSVFIVLVIWITLECAVNAHSWENNQIKKWIYYFFKFIVIQLQLYAFSPHPSTPPQLNPPPSPTSTLPLGFVHVSFIVVPVKKVDLRRDIL